MGCISDSHSWAYAGNPYDGDRPCECGKKLWKNRYKSTLSIHEMGVRAYQAEIAALKKKVQAIGSQKTDELRKKRSVSEMLSATIQECDRLYSRVAELEAQLEQAKQ